MQVITDEEYLQDMICSQSKMKDDSMRYDCLVKKINSMLDEAISHGGDSGGAYYSNRDGLIKEMRDFLKWSGLDKMFGIMDEGGVLRFYKKSNIVE